MSEKILQSGDIGKNGGIRTFDNSILSKSNDKTDKNSQDRSFFLLRGRVGYTLKGTGVINNVHI